MAFNANNQMWLTYALVDSQVPHALTLCYSLKNVFTSRRVAVIVSRKVCPHLREKLDHAFDCLFILDEDRNTGGLKDEVFVKLYALTLNFLEKCIFLAPTMLALKNCDELFDDCNQTPSPELFARRIEKEMSIFVVRPSSQTFKAVMNVLQAKNGKEVSSYVCLTDCSKYNRLLSPQNGTLLGNEKDLSLVNVVNIPFDEDTDDFGMLSRIVLELRRKIYRKNVLPLLESVVDIDSGLSCGGTTYNKEPIAIVGMSCRYPGANNLEEFWNLLINSEDATGTPPEFRWRRDQSIQLDDKFRKTNAGFLKGKVDEFDAKFFGISPMELSCMDPQHRLLLELVWESLEDAAIQPPTLKGSTGSVFVGTWANDFKDILSASGNSEFYRNYMGNSIGAAAARISFLLGLTGPSIATESGCSSSMVAVHLACRSLQNGEGRLALACGVNLMFEPFDNTKMPMALSPDGHCKTFDKTANGFARAEGAGVLVLKRLSDAVKDGDRIWALVRGTGVSQEGVSKSMGTPTVHSEALAMKQALADSGVDPGLISYVEAHGTGTVVGDPIEVSAIAEAYHSKARQEPLFIGSVKTNVGHTESCSGITGIMKVVLAMHHEIIPAHRNFEELNPAIDLNAVPARIPLKAVEWQKSPGKPRFAGVSSFGITGTDSHCILEESPEVQNNFPNCPNLRKQPLEIMKISAKTEEALDILLENYEDFMTKTTCDLKDLTYTANTGRSDFSHRAILIGKGKEEMLKNFEGKKFLRGEETLENDMGKICFLFTGQGSQYPGMAKELYETSPVFRMHFEYCESLLKSKYKIDIGKTLWKSSGDEISRTLYSQTSIFCVEYALLKLWESWGVKPDYVLGHSLGEFPAAVCAGILSVEDALKLVAERSRLIDQLPHGKMLVIKSDKPRVDTLMNKFGKELDYAAINSREQTVVAGDSEIVLKFSEYCKNAGLKCIVLESTHAFHSKHMDPMLDIYRNVIKTVKIQDTLKSKCKFISSVRGKLAEDNEPIDEEYWIQHTREKVLFLEASRKAVELGCRTFIEIGPQPVLSALTMLNNESKFHLTCLPSLKKKENEWQTILNTLGKLYVTGMNVDWEGLHQFEEHRIVSLPHYPFIGKRFWPELVSTSGASIHPLIGSVIPNASGAKLFQSGLKPQGGLEYVKDHCIGTNIIFPGAGYLEMALAAGLGTIEGSTDSLSLPPSLAIKVENLVIEAPLLLEESSTCQMQTVACFDTDNEIQKEWNYVNVKIYRRATSEANKWEAHATAQFSPLPTVEEKDTSAFSDCAFHEILSKDTSDKEQTDDMYDRMASSGIKFGPAFRSLEKVWRDEEKGTLLSKVKIPTGISQYVVHPVVIDAMMQSIAILHPDNASSKKLLQIPVKIEKFVWLGGTSSSSSSANCELYIHAFENKNDRNNTGKTTNRTAMLFDSSGNVIATMTGLELVETTVKSIESVLEQQQSILPEFWEEVWKPTPSLIDSATDMEKAKGKFYSDEFHTDFENKYNTNLNPCRNDIFRNLEKMVYLNFLRGMYQLGWKPEVRTNFVESSLFKELSIGVEFRQYFSFMCEVFEAEGLFKKMGESNGEITWFLPDFPPSQEEVEASLNTVELSGDLVQRFPSTQLMQEFGNRLSGILKGSQSALSILFSTENRSYPTVAELYHDILQVFNVSKLALPVQVLLKHITDSQSKTGSYQVRILEVGGGTASYSRYIFEALETLGIPFEYTFTDISTSFFSDAATMFEKQLKSIKFEKLNIEVDPIEQGFIPDYFDVVIAADVVHATKNIAESLQNLRILMKPLGRLAVIETTRVNRISTFLFGTLDGYCRFTDFELRQKYCILEDDKWSQVMQSNGLEIEGVFRVFNSKHSVMVSQKLGSTPFATKQAKKTWLVFHQPDNQISCSLRAKIYNVPGRNVVTVIPGGNFEQGMIERGGSFVVRKNVFEDFACLLKTFMKNAEIEGIIYCWALDKTATAQTEVLQPFFNLTKGVLALNLKVNPRLAVITSGVLPFNDNDLSTFHSGTLWGYSKSMKNEHFLFNCKCIEVADERMDENRIQEIFYEVWSSDKEMQVAFWGNARYVPKFQPHKAVSTALKLPPGTDRFQLVFPDTKSISDLQLGPLNLSSSLSDEYVEVKIKVSALNFKDILSVLKPTDEFTNAVGLDFSGVVKRVGAKVTKWSVGDRVFGLNMEDMGLPSYVHVHQNLLLRQPDHFTFCEVATIPAVYVTSIVCLLDEAKIKKGEVVLIHTAAGGVGLSAIEICKNVGCTIIATAGSKRKQNYLRSLGIQHIFHSRNTKFGAQILELTNGRGVDVVLNSLTSEGFKEATLQSCAKNARFIEMSKLNIWKPEEVKERRPDVDYTIVDVSSADLAEMTRYFGVLQDLLEQEVVKPIPYVRFDAQNIREALRHLQKARQIGKVVCVMPMMRNEGGEIKIHTPMFHDNCSYLVTGGLGGIGFVVCQWMVDKGAKHVILAGRNAPSTAIQSVINDMNSKGANVIPLKLDVGNFDDCKELLEVKMREMSLPTLKGIMHAAGTLADGIITNQEWPKLSSTFNAKVNGTLNLHELTKHLNLEHFVLYSSVAAMFGLPGQCNHSAGNAFEDAFAHYRHSIGLPGTTINWGQWGEVGIARELDLPGLKPFSNVQGIAGLEYVMKTQQHQLSVLNIESFVLLNKLVPQLSIYLDERYWKASTQSNSVSIKSDVFWQQYDSASDIGVRMDLLKGILRSIVRSTLRMDEKDAIEDNANLQEMGVDSLMFVEIRHHIQMQMKDRLIVSAGAIQDCHTINLLAETLFNLIEAEKNECSANESDGKGDDGTIIVENFLSEDSLLSHTVYKPVVPEASVGEPILIAHGMLVSRWIWDSVARAIVNATGRTVITFDTRHHGDSPCLPGLTYEHMVDDVFNLSHHLNLNKFSLLGHSIGGNTALAFTLKYPQFVEKVVAVDVSPFDVDSVFQNFVQAAEKVVSILGSRSASFSEAKSMVDPVIQEISEPSIRAFMGANLKNIDGKLVWSGKPGFEVLLNNRDELMGFPKELLDRKFDAPALFIKGENSGMISKSSFSQTQTLFGRAQLSIVANAGHFPPTDNFEGFMNILLPFISS